MSRGGAPSAPTRSIRTFIGCSRSQSPKNWRIQTLSTSGVVRIQLPGCGSGLRVTTKLPSHSVSSSSPSSRPTSADSPAGTVSTGRAAEKATKCALPRLPASR